MLARTVLVVLIRDVGVIPWAMVATIETPFYCAVGRFRCATVAIALYNAVLACRARSVSWFVLEFNTLSLPLLPLELDKTTVYGSQDCEMCRKVLFQRAVSMTFAPIDRLQPLDVTTKGNPRHCPEAVERICDYISNPRPLSTSRVALRCIILD